MPRLARSMSTTLTLNPVSTVECLQQMQYSQVASNSCFNNNNNNNNKNNSAAYFHFPHHTEEQQSLLLQDSESLYSDQYNTLPTEDAMLLERMPLSSTSTRMADSSVTSVLQKSNSYDGSGSIIKPKATILKQDSLNGRIATSLTDSDTEYGVLTPQGGSSSSVMLNEVVIDGEEESDPFLVGSNSSNANSTTSSRRGTRSHGKSRASVCSRAHAFINRNWYLSYLVPLSILLALMFVAYLTRNYAKRLLYWIETQNPWVIFGLFMLLFILVSFPVVVGYFVLMITAGYLFGCLKGFLTVILGANMGIAVAHVTIRSLRHRIPMHKLIKNETGRAILRVISGPRAFKVVLFTRLTPLPFGIQNAIFGVSSINPRIYHSATFLGLLPAQTINVYLGSTLRSMHEVLNNHGTAVTGYITFGVEVICGVALMFWVVQKARKELSETLLSDISAEGKLIDIQV